MKLFIERTPFGLQYSFSKTEHTVITINNIPQNNYENVNGWVEQLGEAINGYMSDFEIASKIEWMIRTYQLSSNVTLHKNPTIKTNQHFGNFQSGSLLNREGNIHEYGSGFTTPLTITDVHVENFSDTVFGAPEHQQESEYTEPITVGWLENIINKVREYTK